MPQTCIFLIGFIVVTTTSLLLVSYIKIPKSRFEVHEASLAYSCVLSTLVLIASCDKLSLLKSLLHSLVPVLTETDKTRPCYFKTGTPSKPYVQKWDQRDAIDQ